MTDTFRTIPINMLVPGVYQPRRHFSEDKLQELADSISSQGVLEPIVVRMADKNSFEIIAGERRFRASKIAGLEKIPTIIKDVTNQEAATIAIVENIQRESLSLLEMADYLSSTIKMFESKAEFGRCIGKSRSWVSNTIRLNNISSDARAIVVANNISDTHARYILSVKPEQQAAVAREIADKKLSVLDTEILIKSTNGIDKKKKPVKEPKRDINIVKLEDAISDFLNTPIEIQFNNGVGKIIAPYYSFEQLQGISEKLISGGFDLDLVYQ